ncbi:hypothetical protein KTQ42_09995|uniref:type IV pilus assembly protein FimV n=1 Tax=Noviherbaspirillum sp. L7-7A TaxID=2850560 RepID=UPI001C2BD1FA|nr:hypothetical protein [Noviherbaspirillum sp. L7-7A]MBV0879631.1 hypothetical protein [Noviherbaspirillum sp. L7-7A]
MKHLATPRPVQRLLLCALAASSVPAQALGLGPLTVQSGLGNPLQATVPVYGIATEELAANCLKARVQALDGNVLSRPSAAVTGSGANASIRINGRESIAEPVVSITVEIGCASAVRREYQVLLDPVPVAQLFAPHASETGQRSTRQPDTTQPAPVKARTAKPAVAAPSATIAQRRSATPSPPKTPVAGKSTLTLATGDAEIEQVRASLVLRHATSLSEPRVENDPARLAALRADQQRVAALLRGENPTANAQAQLRDAQLAMKTARQDALEARRQMDDERKAMEAERRDMIPALWASVLATLALVGMIASGWLLWRRRQDQRRHHDELAMLAMPFDTVMPETNAARGTAPASEDRLHSAPAAPLREPPPAGIMATAATAAIQPAAFDWGAHPHELPVATTPPDAVDMPASWQLIEQQIDGLRDQAPATAEMAVQVMVDGPAQSHAMQVADMLLAAEAWMAEHNPKRAADLLQPYMEREDMLSPAPGLYLLTLYRTLEDDDRIQAVKAQLQAWFPAEVSHWSAGAQERRTIADFPDVHPMIDALKDSNALLPYLRGLLLAPQPFDFSTYREIVRAIGIALETVKTDEISAMALDFH